MSNYFVDAKLTSLNTVRIMIFTDIPRREHINFCLYKNDVIKKLHLIKSVSQQSITFFDLLLNEKIEFGASYTIAIEDFGSVPLDVSNAIYFKEFDELFNYDGDDLGAIYTKNETRFALWAPLASSVTLRIKTENGLDSYPCQRTDKGIYRFALKGDLLNREYDYIVTNNGISLKTLDPYGKGVSLNSEYSAVVDTIVIKNRKKIKPKTVINNYVDAIIYEMSIRDFTEIAPNIVNQGKYLGLCEDNKKTKNNNPLGLSYLKDLGITHVQLQPITDFQGVDDVNVKKSYNWGYDPISMFALEGSYSTNPHIPQERLNEFAFLIDTLHKNDIRVNIDIVFNHVYNYVTSTFERIVPHYFFRNKKNGQAADASGCGNDFASERYMARKIIKDALKHFIEVFDIDGIRFDLMGLIDKTTIDESFNDMKNIKKDLMYYGEGWNMGNELPMLERLIQENAQILPNYAFFNDMFRNVIRGPHGGNDVYKKGYINGDINYVDAVEFVLAGSILRYTYTPKYISANQSLNYVECHDDCTLYDKLCFSNKEENKETLLKRVKIANTLAMLSIGIPFIHMGQEIGLSKNMERNTYNIVNINNMDWTLVDERIDMVQYLKSLIAIRKNNSVFHISDTKDIDNCISFYKGHGGVFLYYLKNKEVDDTLKELVVIINPSYNVISWPIEQDGLKVILTTSSRYNENDIISKEIEVEPVSVTILAK